MVMCVCLCLRVYSCVNTHVHVHIHVYAFMCVQVYVCVQEHTCVSICLGTKRGTVSTGILYSLAFCGAGSLTGAWPAQKSPALGLQV